MTDQINYGYDCSSYKKPQIILKNIELFKNFLKNLPETEELKMDFKVDEKNIGVWKIKIYDIPECNLKTSLLKLSENINKKVPLKLIIEFPFEFPFRPPFIWIKSPRIIYCDGGIAGIFNGVICTDVLMPSNWSPIYSIDKLIVILINILNCGAKVENESKYLKNSRESALGPSGLGHIKTVHPEWI
jgi:ubiquitin-protein ligase